MKKLLLLTILLGGFILSGCGISNKDIDRAIKDIDRAINGYTEENCPECLVSLTQETFKKIIENIETQNQHWEMLKDYLGVVEWKEIYGEKTYLTKDPLKVEWVKLGCDNPLDKEILFQEEFKIWERCNQLKINSVD